MKEYFQIVIGLLLIVLVLLLGTYFTSWGWALLILVKGGVLAAVALIGVAFIALGVMEAKENEAH
jgi:phosphoglycerol transferase MdoB-like AlkP superfamily enzyme